MPVEYGLFVQARSPAPWSADPGLDDDAGRTTEWKLYRLECTEELSEVSRCELILVRQEPLPPPVVHHKPETVFDRAHNRLQDLENKNRDIDNAARNFMNGMPGPGATPGAWNNAVNNPANQANANKYTKAWNDFGDAAKRDGGAEGQDLLNTLGNPGSWEKDVLGMEPDAAVWVGPTPPDPADWVGTTCSVRVTRRDAADQRVGRWFTGMVAEFEDHGNLPSGWRVLRLVLVPTLWKLSLRRDCRIFTGMTAVEIVDDVLARAGLYASLDRWLQPPGSDVATWTAPREYCVQYNESDLDFVRRVLEEEGIVFLFDHRKNVERLILADAAVVKQGLLRPLDAGGTRGDELPWFVSIPDPSALGLEREIAWGVTLRKTLRARKFELRDYNFSNPLQPIDPPAAVKAGETAAAREVYGYPARFQLDLHDDPTGWSYRARARPTPAAATFRLDAVRAREVMGRGQSSVIAMLPGLAATLRQSGNDHPAAPATFKAEDEFLVTAVQHLLYPADTELGTGASPADLPQPVKTVDARETAAGNKGKGYTNHFRCAPGEALFRRELRTPRPVIAGLQTATVVGPGADDTGGDSLTRDAIHVDPLGRIRVRFHWDRREELGTPPTEARGQRCWVRVSQSWAGDGWGTVFIPRVGMEVVVGFVEGDPDKPMVVGAAYNRLNPMPIEHRHLDYTSKPNRVATEEGRLHYDEAKQRHVADRDINLVRTRSHPGGDGKDFRRGRAQDHDIHGFNELSFVDTRGGERLRVHAEQDFREKVRHDHKTKVHGDQINVVHNDQRETVGADQVLVVKGRREKVVHGDETTHVGGRRTEELFGKEELLVTGHREHDVVGREDITIGRPPPAPDTMLRRLDVHGHRKTSVRGDDTLTIAKEKLDTLTGDYQAAAGKLSIAVPDKDQARAGIHTDDDGVKVESKGEPGDIEVRSHGARGADGTPLNVTIKATRRALFESLGTEYPQGVSLVCGDCRLHVLYDQVRLEAPNGITLSCGTSVVHLEKQHLTLTTHSKDAAQDPPPSKAFILLHASGDASAADDAPDISGEAADYDRPDLTLPPPDADEGKLLDWKLPGILLTGDVLTVDGLVSVTSEKGVDVQQTESTPPQRVFSPREDDLYQHWIDLLNTANTEIDKIPPLVTAAAAAKTEWEEQSKKVAAITESLRKPGGSIDQWETAARAYAQAQQDLLDAQARKDKHAKEMDEAKDKGRDKDLDKAQTDFEIAKEAVDDDTREVDRTKKDFDARAEAASGDLKQFADETGKEAQLMGDWQKAERDLAAQRKTADDARDAADRAKIEYDRRSAARKNG